MQQFARPADHLTVAEAASRLGVTRAAILLAIRNGRLPATRFGWGRTGAWLVARPDLEEYAAGRPQKIKPGPKPRQLAVGSGQ